VHSTYAALTPLLAAGSPLSGLAGISLPVTITARADGRNAASTGGFLFTHRGYSGPSVLDVSPVAVRSFGPDPARLTVRWTAREERAWDTALRAAGTRTVGGALRQEFPDRLADALAALAGVEPARPLARLAREERLRLVETSRGGRFLTGHEGTRRPR
jgi:predicted flavoprotein YhiN